MWHSHHQSRARVRVQHQPYPSAIFGTQASLKNATGHVRCFLRTVVHVFFLYLVLLLAVWISSQLITAPSGAEVPVVSDPDWPNPDLFNGSMNDVWRHVEQDEECFHCLFENWMKDDPGMSDLLNCLLSDEVTTIPVHVRSTHVLSMKHCTALNAMFRRMTILVITFVRQVAVSLLVTFLGLSTLLREEMLAHSATGKKGKKDAFCPRRKEGTFEFIFVPSPFTISVAVVKRYKRLAVHKELHNLLLKFPSLNIQRRIKFARRIHGRLVVSFTIRRSFVMCIRFKHSRSCLALLRCIAHLVKGLLAQAVSAVPSVLVCSLLLLAGDVEVNPGPITVSEVLEIYEDEFFEVVNAKYNLLKLVRKGVITQDIERRISATNDADAREILYDHLKHHSSLETLREYCNVAIAADGYPNMQRLAQKIIKELTQNGWTARPFEPRLTETSAVGYHPHIVGQHQGPPLPGQTPFLPSQPVYGKGPSGVGYHPHIMGQYQVSEDNPQEVRGRAQSDHHGVSPSSTALPSAEEVLEEFRDRFIREVDPNAVVNELQHEGLIPQGDQAEISRTKGDRQKNQLLHQCLVRTCTREALIRACRIFIAEAKGNPAMKAFGEDMMKRLEPGQVTPPPPTTPEREALSGSTSEGKAVLPPPNTTEDQPTLRYRPGSTPITPHQIRPSRPTPFPTSLYSSPLQRVLIVAILVLVFCLPFVFIRMMY